MESQFIKLLDYSYALICKSCKSKVLDPDKKKNQIYLNGKCPSCGASSVEHKKSKKQRKRERKELAKLQRSLKDQVGSLSLRGILA